MVLLQAGGEPGQSTEPSIPDLMTAIVDRESVESEPDDRIRVDERGVVLEGRGGVESDARPRC